MYVRPLEACLNGLETCKFCDLKDKSGLHAGSSSISRRRKDFIWSETLCAAWGADSVVQQDDAVGEYLTAWTVSFEVRGRSGFLDGPLALFGRIHCCSNYIRC